MIDILIPVLDRPHRVEPLLENIASTTSVPHQVLFLCSKGDKAEIKAVTAAGAKKSLLDAPPANGQYAKKINLGFRRTKGEWLFLAADDLRFKPGWAEAAIAAARKRVSVVATNDRANYFVQKGLLATHCLIRREYILEQGGSLDGPGKIYHEGYSHNFVDCELSVLARNRGVFQYARDAIVEHLHPTFRKAPMDATYEIGLRDFVQDRELFMKRMVDFPRDQLVRRFTAAAKGRR
jgi:hypothetical protein